MKTVAVLTVQIEDDTEVSDLDPSLKKRCFDVGQAMHPAFVSIDEKQDDPVLKYTITVRNDLEPRTKLKQVYP